MSRPRYKCNNCGNEGEPDKHFICYKCGGHNIKTWMEKNEKMDNINKQLNDFIYELGLLQARLYGSRGKSE